MSLNQRIQNLRMRIVGLEKLLDQVNPNSLMYDNLQEHIEELKEELQTLPEEEITQKIQMLFSGNAVSGSEGIKASFVAKILTPFQEMVKIKTAAIRNQYVAKRGVVKDGAISELYLTALPVGSFGIELSILDPKDLFVHEEMPEAIEEVLKTIKNVVTDPDNLDNYIKNAATRELRNLKNFLSAIAKEDSILTIQGFKSSLEFQSSQIKNVVGRMRESSEEERTVEIKGVLRGLMADSQEFELLTDGEEGIKGSFHTSLDESKLLIFASYMYKKCIFTLFIIDTIYQEEVTGTEYQLKDIVLEDEYSEKKNFENN